MMVQTTKKEDIGLAMGKKMKISINIAFKVKRDIKKKGSFKQKLMSQNIISSKKKKINFESWPILVGVLSDPSLYNVSFDNIDRALRVKLS